MDKNPFESWRVEDSPNPGHITLDVRDNVGTQGPIVFFLATEAANTTTYSWSTWRLEPTNPTSKERLKTL